jgi:hypothetical protein
MEITDSRARDILRWLDDQAGDHTNLFEQMTFYRDAAALIRQLQAAEQSGWHALLEKLLRVMDDERNITEPPQAPGAR